MFLFKVLAFFDYILRIKFKISYNFNLDRWIHQNLPSDEPSEEYDDDFECESDEEKTRPDSVNGESNGNGNSESEPDPFGDAVSKDGTNSTYTAKAANLRKFLIERFKGDKAAFEEAYGLLRAAADGADSESSERKNGKNDSDLQSKIEAIAGRQGIVNAKADLFPLLQILCFLESTLDKGS